MATTSLSPLQTDEELDLVLDAILLNFEWKEAAFCLDIGGIVISIEQKPEPFHLVRVKLTIENNTGLVPDAGMLSLVYSSMADTLTETFRPWDHGRFEYVTKIPVGIYKLSLWEQ